MNNIRKEKKERKKKEHTDEKNTQVRREEIVGKIKRREYKKKEGIEL